MGPTPQETNLNPNPSVPILTSNPPLPSRSLSFFSASLFPIPTMNKNSSSNNNNPYHHHLHQNPSTFFILPNPPITADPITTSRDQEQEQGRDRFPQWTQVETRQFLAIRAQLDRSFAETKRNKPLWEAVASQMQQLGFLRTPEQCKSKWKNLVTRYKGSESVEHDRSFPFQDEMRTIFADRLLKGKEKAEIEEEEGEEEKKLKRKRRRKGGEVEEALREFGRRQMEMERRRMEAAEAREAERRWKEEEWRRGMAALAEERATMEREWMQKEEERRAREEARDERRHAIITAILTKMAEKASFQN